MPEYIEREALLERIDDIWDCADLVFEPNDHCCRVDDCGSCKWAETKNAIRKIIANFPAADVRPVVKACWIGEGDGYADGEMVYDVWHCSNCDYTVDEGDNEPPRYNYCPNCGADMREES